MDVCIIAEAGVNHNGNLETAKKMIEAAKLAGANYIKFQTFVPESMVTQEASMAEYQKKNSGKKLSQLDLLKKLALDFQDFKTLKKCCVEMKIGFLSTPFDFESIEFLDDLEMDLWKIPSGEITNLPYLEKISETGKPVILSTGMSTMSEIEEAVSILNSNSKTKITLLHCNTQYPTPYANVNLRAMIEMQEYFHLPVGYSDHTLGIEVPIAATALGATVIEKHFTLDRTSQGPDHAASLEPQELKLMVDSIRNISQALGNQEKKPGDDELKNLPIVRKSIVAKRRIQKGEIFGEDNITVKRPAYGISPMKWHEVIGKTAKQNFEKDAYISL